MTPTTKAALDAAEIALKKPFNPNRAASNALRLIAEARKAEEWQGIESAPKDGTQMLASAIGGMYIFLWVKDTDFVSGLREGWTSGDQNAEGLYYQVWPTHWRPLPAPPDPTTCTACDEPITGTVHYDVNQLPFDTDCYEDLCRAMASVPEGEK